MAFLTRNSTKTPLGIYIHIPFCRSKCRYCDFYSVPCKEDTLMDRFLDAICDHIKEAGALAPNYRVDTVYFGGGTPSYFGAEALAIIMTNLRRSFDVATDAEITFEANPDSVTEKLLHRLRAEGFNRMSLGIQTDDPQLLRTLGRPHDYKQATYAFDLARKEGFRNISVDLMYGLPGQTREAWEGTLHHVLQLGPNHISCYGLKVEENTPFWDVKHQLNLPDDDLQADMYLAACDILWDRGYRQYEISNFAKKKMVSRHNLKYWTGGEYLGFGPSASSDFAGKRFTMVSDLETYINGIRQGGNIMADVQQIPLRERAGEYIMLRLRTSVGIFREEYEKRFMLPFDPIEDVMKKKRNLGLATNTDTGGWILTPRGYLLSNDIISDALIAQEDSRPLRRI